MTKMVIPITKVRDNVNIGELFAIPKISSIFALTIIFAILAGIITGFWLRSTKIDPRMQTAGVGNISITENPPVTAASAVPPNTQGTNVYAEAHDTISTNAEIRAIEVERAEKMNAIVISINAHQTAITEVARELHAIKDESVALVLAFEQNCGNWEDDCARPYSDVLEANNARYSERMARLAVLTQELANLQYDQAALQ